MQIDIAIALVLVLLLMILCLAVPKAERIIYLATLCMAAVYFAMQLFLRIRR